MDFLALDFTKHLLEQEWEQEFTSNDYNYSLNGRGHSNQFNV